MDEKSKNTSFPMLLAVIVTIIAVVAISGIFLLVTNNNDHSNDTYNATPTQETTTTLTIPEETTGDTTQNPQSAESNTIAPETGLYVEYSPGILEDHQSKKTVYFFYASWCPSCQALNSDIESNMNSIPADTVIIKVNYDSASGATQEELDLKSKYGVSSQHTLVQVTSDGTKVKTWSSSFSLDDVVKQLQ